MKQATTRAIAEILERVTNGRRQRTYPRVSKRGNRHNFPTKKPEHRASPYHPRPLLQHPPLRI